MSSVEAKPHAGTAQVIDGRAVAGRVTEAAGQAAAELVRRAGLRPGLAVVIVGEDPASRAYVGAKERMAAACGFHSVRHDLPATASQDELGLLVSALNADPAVHGILIQLPLPSSLRSAPVIAAIRPEKDVDGLHPVNAGKVASGDFRTGLVSCTPAGAMKLVETVHGANLAGLEAVVIGRSNLFGKPMGQLLLARDATVTMAHSRTRDLPGVCRRADILVVAVGRASMVRGDWVKPGATVIDVGINRVPAPERGEGATRLVGDVAFTECTAVAGAITPVPGGVGPTTIAMLMANTVTAAYRSAGLEPPEL